MLNVRTIYCIGDSHVSFFSGRDAIQPLWPEPSNDKYPFFRTFRIGAVLAYSLKSYGTRLKGREILFTLLDRQVPVQYRAVPPKSKVLLCFGEIDCRVHILRQAELQARRVPDIVDETVKRYFSVIREVKNLGYEVLVWNVIPSSRYDEIPNKDLPVYGSCSERNQVSILFNLRLQELCNESGINFISIFDKLIDEDGLTDMQYYMDAVHLSQKAMPIALEEFRKVLGNDFFEHQRPGRFPLLYQFLRRARGYQK